MVRHQVREAIKEVLIDPKVRDAVRINPKQGKRLIQPWIAQQLKAAGYFVDLEDVNRLLPSGVPVWRDHWSGQIVPTRGRRRVDGVVYRNRGDALPIAIVEVESELGHACSESKDAVYRVDSIARNNQNKPFDSYQSIERLATLARWLHLRQQDPSAQKDEIRAALEGVTSNDSKIQNPCGIPLFLAVGRCRNRERTVLQPRLDSLEVELLFAVDF